MSFFVDDLFTAVRDIADTDSTELTDSVARIYLFKGFDEVVTRQGDWKHFEIEDSFSTVADQRDYAFTTVYTPTVSDGSTLVDITLVTDDSNYAYNLKWVDYEDARRIWHGVNDISANPFYWSVRRTTGTPYLCLWPKPDSIRTITINGYRSENDWKADAVSAPAAAVIDLPVRLQYTLIDYVLSCWYDQQEDLEMADKYRKKFEVAVGTIMADEQRSTQARPLIMGGGHRPYMNEKRWREGLNRQL